jgi:hypothetical protein
MILVLAATLVHGMEHLGYGADAVPTTLPPKAATSRAGPSPPTVDEWDRKREDRWKRPEMPALRDIDSLTAEAYCYLLPMIYDIAPFTVPKKYYRELLKQFENAELDKRASIEDEEMGTLLIRLVGGRCMRICWFWAGQKCRLRFSWCGMRYRAVGPCFANDETLSLDAMVRHIHKKEVLHEKD